MITLSIAIAAAVSCFMVKQFVMSTAATYINFYKK